MNGLLMAGMSVVLVVLLVLGGLTLLNMAVLPDLRRFPPGPTMPQAARPEGRPFVSVLVPARDEAANIEACVRGLLAQDYPAFEILVLDDGSTDDTAAIVARLARADSRMRLLRGGILPPGWLGKANACRQLAEHARGNLLLFTDADVRHAPALLGHAVAALTTLDVDLLSIFPAQITETWAERLAVPVMLHFAVYALLPLPLMRRVQSPAFAAANGEFMLFRRAAYYACGGHAAVRAAVLEDVGLARAMKAAGFRIALAGGAGLVACRMYRKADEVWAGFSKNLFAFFGRSHLFLAVGLLLAACLWVLPPLVALWGLATGDTSLAGLALASYAVAVLTRLALAARFRGRPGDTLLHPLAIAYLMAVGVNSARLAGRGGAIWKGRPVGGRWTIDGGE